MNNFNEAIDEEHVMRWMGIVIADSYGNGMDEQEAAQAFRQMVTHLNAHIYAAEATSAAVKHGGAGPLPFS